jgi:hypothetical protein
MLSDEDLKLILSSDPDGMFGGLILILDNKLTNLQGAGGLSQHGNTSRLYTHF